VLKPFNYLQSSPVARYEKKLELQQVIYFNTATNSWENGNTEGFMPVSYFIKIFQKVNASFNF
jgi:hypothetical protein